ncbi:glycosyltransferase family 4 protein [Mycolicibacterium komossense]|uniref:Glycosyltransferase family 4 protein n=2 Tax=Mycolicibacterium komossense TaxID=1779 RepID=A0ABT3CJN2_9MYCO|nr:glycosyltransferase family 4 protein [Mycolicibacterium komossense]
MVSALALPEMGGIETHVHEVSKRLAGAGVHVTVLTADRAGQLPAAEQFPGYQVRRWRTYPGSRDYCLAPGLLRHLISEPYDVVHVQGIRTLLAPTALAAARRAKVPSVLTLHTGGNRSALRQSLRPLQFRICLPMLRHAAAVVAVCEYERHNFASLLGVGDDAIRLIRNGSDPLPIDPFAEKEIGSPLLVSVGRLERFKGHHRILGAMPNILAQAPGARLVLVGDGPYEKALHAMAERLGVADRVSICSFGPERRGSLGRLVADADLFCLLSESEAHPIAVMEAVGAGTTALVADTTGLSELGRAGLVNTIALKSSAEEIATAALDLAAAPRIAPPHLLSWDECAEQLHQLYREIAT